MRRVQSQGSVVAVQPQVATTTLVRLRKDALENDTRGVQRRIATNRIQQEIEEACEREMELRTEGKILTTSLETVTHLDLSVLKLLIMIFKGGQQSHAIHAIGATSYAIAIAKSDHTASNFPKYTVGSGECFTLAQGHFN